MLNDLMAGPFPDLLRQVRVTDFQLSEMLLAQSLIERQRFDRPFSSRYQRAS